MVVSLLPSQGNGLPGHQRTHGVKAAFLLLLLKKGQSICTRTRLAEDSRLAPLCDVTSVPFQDG